MRSDTRCVLLTETECKQRQGEAFKLLNLLYYCKNKTGSTTVEIFMITNVSNDNENEK